MRKSRWSPIRANYKNQTWLVTGASDGIGATIAEIAALNGARVITVARSKDKMLALKNRVATRIESMGVRKRHAAKGSIVPAVCDLSDMEDVSRLVDQLSRKVKIDALINNVGILNNNYIESPQGFEQSYAVNLLGQFHLTESLFRQNVFGRSPLLITMSSGGLYNLPFNLGLLDQEASRFDGAMAYASHKRAQIALTDHWRRVHSGNHLFAYTMHPGWVRTSGVENSLPVFNKFLKSILRTTTQGADTALWLAQKRPGTRENVVWFDRKQRSPYLYSDTRKARTTTEDLLIFLENDVRIALQGKS